MGSSGSMGSAVLGGISGFTSSYGAAQSNYNQQLAAWQANEAQIQVLKKQADDEAWKRRINAIVNLEQLQQQENEINRAASQQALQARVEYARHRAQQYVASSDANLSGPTVERLQRLGKMAQTFQENNIETNRTAQQAQVNAERRGVWWSAQMQPVYYTQWEKPDKPSIFGSILAGISGFLGNGGSDLFSCNPTASAQAAYTPPAAVQFQSQMAAPKQYQYSTSNGYSVSRGTPSFGLASNGYSAAYRPNVAVNPSVNVSGIGSTR